MSILSPATIHDFAAIASLNVEAYREFSAHMTAEHWHGMETSIRAVEARAQFTHFLVIRDHGTVVGSVGYCPAGKGDREIFPPDWAAMLLLAVAPTQRRHGLARELASACIERARQDSTRVIGLFTSELMIAAQQLYESLGFRREHDLPPRFGLRYWRYKLPLRTEGKVCNGYS